MRVVGIALTAVKGMAHVQRDRVELAPNGPVGDRVFCLVDPATQRVLRTVNDDSLMRCRARWEAPQLTIETPVGTVTGEVRDGDERKADYWGRTASLIDVEGPWSELLSEYVGRAVRLCRVAAEGEVVWAGSVSIVTTSSLAELACRVGRTGDDGGRFRATLVVDTGDQAAFVEDTWTQLRIGGATLAVRGPLARCAVVDGKPGQGGHDVSVLKALAPDRTRDGEIVFGVSADVIGPSVVARGDVAVAGARTN